MAINWIKMRESLHEDPAVLHMAERLNTRPEHVVGYCHKFWSWVSRNCYDGSVTGVTLSALESVLALPQFPELLRDVGWLLYEENEGKSLITIPKFDRHLSQGAKARALASERVRNARVTKLLRKQRNKIATRGDKRREDSNTPIVPFSESVSQRVRDAIIAWLTTKAKAYKPQALKALATRVENRIASHGEQAVIDAIEKALANGWKGWDFDEAFAKAPKIQRLPTPEEDAAWTP